MSKIIATEKRSQKKIEFNTLVEAEEATGVDRRIISRALADPFHWVHQAGPRTLKDGTYSVHRKSCEWDFWREQKPPIAELWPRDTEMKHKEFRSMYELSKFLCMSRVQLYRMRKSTNIGEVCERVVTDKEGYEWYLVFNASIQDTPERLKKETKETDDETI